MLKYIVKYKRECERRKIELQDRLTVKEGQVTGEAFCKIVA